MGDIFKVRYFLNYQTAIIFSDINENTNENMFKRAFEKVFIVLMSEEKMRINNNNNNKFVVINQRKCGNATLFQFCVQRSA